MLSQYWVVSALCAVTLAAPTLPYYTNATTKPAEMTILADYFRLLGENVASLRSGEAPVCDFTKASMPEATPSPLPAIGEGLRLKHVAIGRGIQNYTCDLSNATAIPVAIGAVATLYDATCLAATFPSLLAFVPAVSLQFNLRSPIQSSLAPSNLVISGTHYFDASGTPVFDLDTTPRKLGIASFKKDAGVNAPSEAVVGQGGVGYGSVQWLKLVVKSSTGGIQEVYRINTAGGKAPATCVGQKAAIEVQYATEYWFYEKPE